VQVNERLQTSCPHIYAVGDVGMSRRLTPVAAASARLAVANALLGGRRRFADILIPRCTLTEPEIATVGRSEAELKAVGISYDTYRQSLADVDRAVIDGEDEGFLKIFTAKGTDRILGATLVAERAGEIINEITLAMTIRLGLEALGHSEHPYPAQAEVVGQAGRQYTQGRFKSWLRNLSERWPARARQHPPRGG